MNKWKKLTVKSEKVKLDDDLEITVHGFRFSEAGTIAHYQERGDREGMLKYILTRTFERAPEFEDKSLIPELVDNIDIGNATRIVEAVFRVSGLEVDDAKKEAAKKLQTERQLVSETE